MALKFCPKCGNELEPDAAFCEACGANLKERTEQAEISTSTPKIEPEGVIYATSLKRIIAFIFDSIIIGLIGSAFSWLLINPWYGLNFFDPIRAWWFTMPFDFLIGFLYHWGLESHNSGQTLGKMAMKLRTVDANTFQVADPGKNAINNLAKPSGFLILDLIIGLISNSGDPQKRIRILQSISDTAVIVVN